MSTKLDNRAFELLNEIFDLTKSVSDGIDAPYYRANHDDGLDILDQLERDGFLIKKDNKYRLSLTSITLLKNKKTQILLEKFEKIFLKLKEYYKINQQEVVKLNTLAEWVDLSIEDVRECLSYMVEASWTAIRSNSFWAEDAHIKPSESILKYRTFYEMITELQKRQDRRIADSIKDKRKKYPKSLIAINPEDNDIWAEIEKDYDVSKRAFGKKVNFVTDTFKRKIIFRDIEQAYKLAVSGFSKPAVILAGSIIEELLRIYLQYKKVTPSGNTFDSYLKACEKHGLLKEAIHRLTDSVRHFRNVVHLEKESSTRHTISKATAKGAVSSIFTIVNDL